MAIGERIPIAATGTVFRSESGWHRVTAQTRDGRLYMHHHDMTKQKARSTARKVFERGSIQPEHWTPVNHGGRAAV